MLGKVFPTTDKQIFVTYLLFAFQIFLSRCLAKSSRKNIGGEHCMRFDSYPLNLNTKNLPRFWMELPRL